MKAQKRSKSSSTNPFSLFLIFSLRLWHNMNREKRVKRKSKKVKIQLHNISQIAISDCIFPIDVMLCILTRLPVKSIIRFKSVCKPWFALLSSPDFKKLHQVQFCNDPRNQTYLFQHSNLSLFQIGSNQKKPTFLNHPFSHKNINFHVVRCFNGFVCLSEKPSNDVIHLWNPALNMSKQIFPLKECEECEECGLHEWVSLGFGYDAETDDLKVVRIVCIESRTHLAGMSAIRVEVYSVNSYSWISIEWDMPFSILRTINDFHVNGMPVWVGSVYYMPVLVYLDLKNMVLKFVPLSQLITGEEMLRQIYFDYNGRIGALMFHIDNDRVIRSVIEVWVYDADDNYWTKNYTLAPIEASLCHIYEWTKNKKVIGKSPDGKLFLCDPETGRVEESVYFGQNRNCVTMYEYTENINHIDGMKRVKVKKRTKKMIVDAAGGN